MSLRPLSPNDGGRTPGRGRLCPILPAILAALCLLAVPPRVAGAAEAGRPIRVEAVGEAAVTGGDTARAREEARRACRRDALEKALGAYVEGITEMRDFALVRDKVLSRSQGLVTEFEPLKEGVEGGIYRIRARCVVQPAKLDGVLGPVVIDALGNPRVLVAVEESIDGAVPFLSTAEGEVQRVFERAGYLMVDARTVRAQRQREFDAALRTGDLAALREMARTFDADVLVVGRAQGVTYTRQVVAGQRLYGVRSQLQLRAIVAQTGYALATEVPEEKALGVSGQDGAVKGLKKAARTASLALVNRIAYALVSGSAGGVPGRVIRLTVADLAFGDAKRVESALGATKGIVSVYRRSFANRRLEADVNLEGSADDLAARLERMGLEILSVTAATVEARSKGAIRP